MLKWIGKGVLKIARGKYIAYGEDIPAKALTKEQLDEHKKAGQIGEVITPVEPDGDTKSRIEDYSRQLSAMTARAEAAEAKVGALEKALDEKNKKKEDKK